MNTTETTGEPQALLATIVPPEQPMGLVPFAPGPVASAPAPAPMSAMDARKIGNRALYSSDHFEVFADLAMKITASHLYGDLKQEQVFVILMKGYEIGLAPFDAMDHIYVVKGKTSLAAKKMIALMEEAGIRVEALEKTDTLARVQFTKPNGQTHIEPFSMEDAKRAGYLANDKYRTDPRTMLFYRAVSIGARAFCPGAIGGMVTPEEAREIEDREVPKPPVSAIPTAKGGAPAGGTTAKGRRAAVSTKPSTAEPKAPAPEKAKEKKKEEPPAPARPSTWTPTRKAWVEARALELSMTPTEIKNGIAKMDGANDDTRHPVVDALKVGDVAKVKSLLSKMAAPKKGKS